MISLLTILLTILIVIEFAQLVVGVLALRHHHAPKSLHGPVR